MSPIGAISVSVTDTENSTVWLDMSADERLMCAPATARRLKGGLARWV